MTGWKLPTQDMRQFLEISCYESVHEKKSESSGGISGFFSAIPCNHIHSDTTVLGYFFFPVFLSFLGPLLQHMEVPRLGVQSEL